jgi:hypothetical protein
MLCQELTKSSVNVGLPHQIESRVEGFFRDLEIPEEPTIYDYMLLALREKDLIATFNWDLFLAQAYRRNLDVRRLPQIVFLHGNVAIGVCTDCRVKGYFGDTCGKCSHALDRTRLLYPVVEKNHISDLLLARNGKRWPSSWIERTY